ncbi:hypothetical protein NMG60_11002517 [Bertholletia excelsa]
MDGSDEGFSPSMSTKPSASAKFSQFGGPDENYVEMGGKLQQNPKKPPLKPFMAPTISAVPKASLPRKKILAERNESADSHHQNTPDFDHKCSLNNSGRSSSIRSRVRDSDNEQNISFSDLSSNPYDPLTNYLSPRPKFLRYRPNRRRNFFLQQKQEIREEDDGAGSLADDVHGDSISFPQEGYGEQEANEEIDMIVTVENEVVDEGIEEFEEETCWSLKGVLKLLLVLVLLFSSTLYISCMNSPTPSPALEAKRGIRDKIQSRAFEAVNANTFEWRNRFLGQRESAPSVNDNEFGEELEVFKGNINGLVQKTDGLSKVVEVQNEQSLSGQELDEEQVFVLSQEIGTGEVDENEWGSVGFPRGEAAKSEEVDHQNSEITRGEISEQTKGIESSQTADHSESFQDNQNPSFSGKLDPYASENEEVYNDLVLEDSLEKESKTEDASPELLDRGTRVEVIESKMEAARSEEVVDHQNFEIRGEISEKMRGIESSQTPDQSEPFQDYQNPSFSGKLDRYAAESKEVRDDLGLQNSQAENEGKTEETSPELLDEGDREEVIQSKIDGVDGMESNNKGPDCTTISQGEESSDEVTIKHSKSELITGTTIGFFIFFVASTVLGFHLVGKQTSGRQSLGEEKLLSETVLAEKISSEGTLPPNVEEEEHEKSEPFANSSPTLVQLNEEASKEFSQTRPPMVELIGEFVVGEVSSSLKSCSTKSKKLEEIEISKISYFEEKMGLRSNAHEASDRVQPCASEFSTSVSPSYGSFTDEKKISKKEGRKDGEVRTEITTPVRRSGRIRNRTVTSP